MPAPTGPASLIKEQIATNLQALVTAGYIGAYVEKPINANALSDELPGFPCVILGSSNLEAEWEFPQSNKRTYRFDLLVLCLQDNITSNRDIENIRDSIALQFDNNVTLAGTAPLGVSAVFSDQFSYADLNRNYVVFTVTIRATTLVSLTYNF